MDNQGKQYEFDIAKSRLEVLGNMVAARTQAYYNFNKNMDEESGQRLLNILRTLWLELESDARENNFDVDEIWSKIESLESRLDGSSKFQAKNFRSKCESINRRIESVRKDAGLDIPSKKLKDREEALLS